MGVSKTIISKHFNSQPHKEADVHFPAVRPPVCHFNSQPHKEADKDISAISVSFSYFNSQPHKEADKKEQHPTAPL